MRIVLDQLQPQGVGRVRGSIEIRYCGFAKRTVIIFPVPANGPKWCASRSAAICVGNPEQIARRHIGDLTNPGLSAAGESIDRMNPLTPPETNSFNQNQLF